MKKNNPGQDEQLKTCWSTMLKYISNVAKVGPLCLNWRLPPECNAAAWICS